MSEQRTSEKQSAWECSNTSQPVCPHCGYKERDAWEWGDAYTSGDKAWCSSCGKEFYAVRNVFVDWTTRP